MVRNPAHILVIEDTELVRTMVIRQLELLGYVASGAEHGAEGLARIRESMPDLVFCDLRMPVLDGLGFLATARAKWPDLPVIVMSGAGLVDDAVGALRVGAVDYLTKPVAGSTVIRHAVERALERVRLKEENSLHRQQLEASNQALRAALSLMAEDEAHGRALQFRMLPRNDLRFGDYAFTRELVPSTYLSGDFIDAFPIGAEHFGFYIADVAGHGVGSALVTVLLRSLVHQQLEGEDEALVRSPARLLAHVNDVVLRDSLDKHLTMFFGVVDLKDDTLRYANAGHFPWPMLFDGKACVPLEQPGLPIGMVRGTVYAEHALKLPRSMVLAAVSDGVLEVLPERGLEAQQARLTEVFSHPEVTAQRARSELGLDVGAALPDDAAILVIRKGAPHATAR